MLEDIENYLKYLSSQKGLTTNSIISYRNDLIKFFEYLEKESLKLENLERHHFRGFLAELNIKKYNKSSINRIIAAIKGFIKYKIRYGYKDRGSILEVESLKTKKKLPKFLFDNEMNILISFDCKNKEDFRDKAIIELIFATGMRVSEISNLKINQIDFDNKQIRVFGKGNKERIVLFGETAANYLKEYQKYRNDFNPKDNYFFLNQKGNRLNERSIRFIIDKRVNEVSLSKKISPHSLRHTFATSLLRNGADIRTVQILLGHSNLSTTEKYTHLGLDELKDIHYKFHPHGKN